MPEPPSWRAAIVREMWWLSQRQDLSLARVKCYAKYFLMKLINLGSIQRYSLLLLFSSIFCFIIVMHLIKDTPVYGWFYGIFAFAATILPLLPTVLIVSVGILDNWLSHRRITYSNSRNILVAGKVQKTCSIRWVLLQRKDLAFCQQEVQIIGSCQVLRSPWEIHYWAWLVVTL